MGDLHPEVRDFIRFCAQRRGREWPALYDEMCLVAGLHLYKGMGRSELKTLGLSLGLSSLEATLRLVDATVSASGEAGPSQGNAPFPR